MSGTLCIAVHDVAPATWHACAPLLELIDDLGAPPATLLVVPDYHRRGTIDRDPAFVAAIDRRLARGDEVALHGYFHLDDGPPPRTPADWLRRRRLTAGEGEFSALDAEQSADRLRAGLRLFRSFGWNARGFIAPAWLLGDGAEHALAQSALGYTSTHAHLHVLGSGRRVRAPAISASTRSRWRRAASRRWLAAARALTEDAPLVRIALHPADAEHDDVLQAWRKLLGALLAERTPRTKSQALGLA